MAAPISVKVALGLETDAAKSNLAAFSNEFKLTLTNLGGKAEDIRFFAEMAKAIDAGKVSLSDYDAKTQALLATFRKGRDIAAARDFLGVPAHAEVQVAIDKTRAAYETLKASGQLTGAELSQAALRTKDRIRELEASTNGWTASLGKMKAELAVAGAAVYGIFNRFGAAASASTAFGKSMAEVSTLLDDTSGMAGMTEAVRELTREYGGDVNVNAKALYDIISAGASDSAAAVDTLTVANKLAMGGVTEVSTAADGLTSAMNAYGDAAGSATEVSDAMFVAVKAGKTTIAELSGSIGQVAPIANAAGVGLEELLASTATLTAGGQSTSQAMNAIKAALSSVIKPTSEASETAKALGLDFSAAALQSKGFAGFLDDVREKTGGNIETMGKLFGSVEGLNGILTLTGQGADKFAATLAAMEEKAGATDAAVAKMMDTPAARSAKFAASMQDIQLSVGDAVTAFSPLLDHLTRLVSGFNNLEPGTRSFVAGTVAAAVALPPLVFAINSFITALGILKTGAILATTAIWGKVTALNALKLAMAGTGIGLLAVGVGLVAEKMIGAADASEQLTQSLPKDKDIAPIKAVPAAAEEVEAKLNSSAEAAKQLGEDLKTLGIDPEEFKSGLTTLEKSLADAFDRMIAQANVSSDQLLVGFANAIQGVGIKGLEEFEFAAQKAFQSGKWSAEQLDAAMQVVEVRSRELTAGLGDLEAAYKALGITSQTELKRTAADMRASYDTLVRMNAPLADQNAAWAKYAEAAIAANGGVADSTITADAAMRGYTVVVDDAGRAHVVAMQRARDSTRDLAREQAQLHAAIAQANDDLARQILAQDNVIGSMQGSIDGFHAHLAVLNAQATAAATAYNQAFYEQNKDIWERLTEIVNKEMSLQANSVLVGEGAMAAYNSAMESTATELRKQVDAVDSYINALTATSAPSASLIADAERASQSMDYLGEQDLAPLRAAIADAQRRMEDLRDAAQSTLDDIQDEWDELNNNLDEIERRRAEKRQAEIEAQLAAAKAAGDREAIADLERALSLLKQITAARIADAKEKERANRSSGSSGSSTGDRTGGMSTGSASTGSPVNINLNGLITSSPAEIARLLKPEIDKLTRLSA